MSMNFGIAEYWYDLYDFLLENTLHVFSFYPKNIPTRSCTDLIWNDGALGCLDQVKIEIGLPNKNSNKLSSDYEIGSRTETSL